jgi:hypothetical protein
MSSAQQQRITEDEQRKYWEIFTALNPVNGYLNGFQAKTVLENSQLDNTQLEAIWDLADVDNGMSCCDAGSFQMETLTLKSFVWL